MLILIVVVAIVLVAVRMLFIAAPCLLGVLI